MRRTASVLFLVGIVSAEATLEFPASDEQARAAILKAIQGDGGSEPITIRRDDTRSIIGSNEFEEELVLFEASEGGSIVDSNGGMELRVPIHPKKWRAYVGLPSLNVYKLSGFSANGFSSLIKLSVTPFDEGRARWLGETFVRLAYDERVEPVMNRFEIRRFVEDEFYQVLEASEVDRIVTRFVKRTRSLLSDVFKQSTISAEAGRYTLNVLVARAIRPLKVEPRVELRLLRITISRDHGLAVERDHLIAAVEAGIDDD